MLGLMLGETEGLVDGEIEGDAELIDPSKILAISSAVKTFPLKIATSSTKVLVEPNKSVPALFKQPILT